MPSVHNKRLGGYGLRVVKCFHNKGNMSSQYNGKKFNNKGKVQESKSHFMLPNSRQNRLFTVYHITEAFTTVFYLLVLVRFI